jgi:hypothetical protein
LAKFSGFPDQTVETGVDEDQNERLIKNDQARDFSASPTSLCPIFPQKHEPFAYGEPFSREVQNGLGIGGCGSAAILERVKRSETNGPI